MKNQDKKITSVSIAFSHVQAMAVYIAVLESKAKEEGKKQARTELMNIAKWLDEYNAEGKKLKATLQELKEVSDELIELGNSHDKEKGRGMKTALERVQKHFE